MEKTIRRKKLELQKIIESYNNCKVVGINSRGVNHNLISKTRVTWKEKGLKWGKIHETKETLRIDIDYPVGLFTEDELCDYTQLPLKEKMLKSKGISHINPTIDDKKHDVIRIILYEDRLDNYDFKNENFMEMIQRIVKSNVL